MDCSCKRGMKNGGIIGGLGEWMLQSEIGTRIAIP